MSVVPEVQMVGGHFAQRAVTFSADGKVFFACSGNGVTVFSVATGEQLQSLEGHSAEVTACVVHPQNSLQLITVSLDSTLRIWDFYDGVCLKTIALNHPALHLVSPNRAPPKTMPTTPSAAASTPSDSNILVYVHLATSKKRSVWSVNLSSSSVEHLYTSGRQCRALAVSPKGLYVASVNKNELYVYAVATRTVKRYAHARDLTVVAFHPTDPYLVTGAVDGQLILWFGFAGSATQPQPQITTSVLHWHAHPVQAATFSDDGAYLLSGGEEAVLVMWQLDTGHRQFLPRLGAPITGIAVGPRGAQYALSCGDNAVRIIGAVSSKVERVVRGLQCAATATSFPTDELNTCGLAIDSRTGHVLVGGLPGSLQLYDSARSRHVAEVPVVARQHVSRTESNNNSTQKSQTRPSVRLTSWHTSGDWLSTVEGRFLKSNSNTNALLPVPGTTDGEESDELMVLKFWRVIRDQQGTTFSLNTRIDQPHKSRVTCVTFHPSRALCVTSSIDRTFKVWRREAKQAPPRPAGSEAPAPAAQEYWLCQSVGFYRHEPINHVAFSPDGSILSVCSGATISLWDPETMQLLRTLSVSTEQETLRASHFVPGSPCLIAHTSTSIMVWNLLTLQLWWQHTVPAGSNISVRALATHSSGHFVAYLDAPTDNNDRPTASVLLDFQIGSPRPARAVLSPALLAGGSETVPVIMFDNTDSLLALTASHELIKLPHFLDPQAPVVPVESSVSDAASVVARLTAEQPVSLFQRLYGGATAASTTLPQSAVQPVSTSSLSSGASHFSSLFSAPTHVVPSMTSLFAAFMQALVKPVSAAAATASSNSTSDAANVNISTSSTTTSTSSTSASVSDDDALFRSETALGLFQWNSQSYLDIVRPQAAAALPASKKSAAAESVAPVKSIRKVAAVEVESVDDEARDTVSALPAGRKRKVAAATATADSDVSDSEGGRPRRSTRAGRASDSELSDSSAPKVPARRGRPPRA